MVYRSKIAIAISNPNKETILLISILAVKLKTMNLSEIKSREIMPGYHGKLVHGEQMSWVFWDVEKDAIVPEHHHIHEQIMHVVEGSFEFTLDGKTNIYQSGDVVIIPSNTPHSGRAITACKLMDIFSPVREEYK